MEERPFAFDSEEYASRFQANRALPSRIEQFWVDYVTGRAFATCRDNTEPSILDVGCGTGRFSVPFSKRGCAVKGIDSSSQMIRQALLYAKGIASTNLSFSRHDIHEHLEQADFDVIFLSEVVHLTNDLEKLFRRCHSLLRVGGSLIVRTASKTQVSKRNFLQFFPTALALEVARHHSLSTLDAALHSAQFDESCHVSIEEGEVVNKADYISSVTERFHSILHLISLEEFEIGLTRMKMSIPEYLCVDFPTTLLRAVKRD